MKNNTTGENIRKYMENLDYFANQEIDITMGIKDKDKRKKSLSPNSLEIINLHPMIPENRKRVIQ